MKYTTASTTAFAIGAIFSVVVACSSGSSPSDKLTDESETDAENDKNGSTQVPAGNNNNNNAPATSNTSTQPPKAKTCVTTCATDSDCANSCPAKTGATACCDQTTKTCFNSTEAVCPVSDGDSGAPPPAY